MFRTTLSMAILLSLSTTASAQVGRVLSVGNDGYPRGRDGAPIAGAKTKLLQSFDFQYTEEHHLRVIKVLQAANSIHVDFADKNSDDPYRWSARFVELHGSDAVLGDVQGRDLRSKAVHVLDAPRGDYVFVLRGFQMEFGIDFGGVTDHHMDEIGVWEEQGRLHIVFNDKNDDDDFSYRVQYAYVPLRLVHRTHTFANRTAGEHLQTAPQGVPVLSGFHFDFASKDHEVQTIQADLRSGNLKIRYADQNADDAYRWRIDMALLKPSAAEPTSTNPGRFGQIVTKPNNSPILHRAK